MGGAPEGIGSLSRGIAHQLATPLNVILARARMIERGEAVGTAVPRDARTIAEQAERISYIIRQLLDFAGAGSQRRQRVSLAQIIAASFAAVETYALARRVELSRSGDELELQADPAQLQRLVINLLLNGIDSQPQGGFVRVEHACAPPSFARLDVTDGGPGIEASLVSRLFEPFFTTKEEGAGAGLGLSVAQGIAAAHGGHIEVASAPGRGSRFSVYLSLDSDVRSERQGLLGRR